jgi:hypothetical protein
MPTKPAGHIGWVPDENAAKAVEPILAKKTLGFVGDERPDFKHHNWLWARIHNWLVYLEAITDQNTAALKDFDAIVGSTAGCTHATLAAAIAAASSGWKILVTESASIATRITVNKADIEITFKPGVVYTKTGDTVCMEYSTARVKVRGGRFVGYSTSGDIVHRYLLGADYCHLLESIFGTGTDTDYDDSAVTAGKKPIVANTIAEV